MLTTLFTTKGKMDQLYVDAKRQVVTWLNLPDQEVIGVHQPDQGKLTLQVAIGKKNIQAKKPVAGQLKAAKLTYQPKWIKEIGLSEKVELQPGDVLPVDQIISAGDLIKVTSTSKGKGFAGVMKRHHFHGGPRTHGQSDRARAPGSISRGPTPVRVLKGKKMAGRMGNDTVSVRNLKIISLDQDNHQIAVSGPVPGATNSLVTVTVIKKHA